MAKSYLDMHLQKVDAVTAYLAQLGPGTLLDFSVALQAGTFPPLLLAGWSAADNVEGIDSILSPTELYDVMVQHGYVQKVSRPANHGHL